MSGWEAKGSGRTHLEKKSVSLLKREVSQVALVVKNLPANAGGVRDTVWSLGQEDPLEKELATHSSILAWRIPLTEEPGRLQSMGLQRVVHDWSNLAQHSTAPRKETQTWALHWKFKFFSLGQPVTLTLTMFLPLGESRWNTKAMARPMAFIGILHRRISDCGSM